MAPRRQNQPHSIFSHIKENYPIYIQIAILVGVVANLWLKASFVDQDTYLKDKAEQSNRENSYTITQKAYQDATTTHLNKLETTIMLIREQNKRNDDQDKMLADHESRLRVLERITPVK